MSSNRRILHCYKDISNQRYSRLIVLNYEYTNKKKAYWKCKCDCGNETIVSATALKSGNTKSCGCLHKEQSRINICKYHPKQIIYAREFEKDIHTRYKCMKSRCYNKNHKAYKNYGGRGIKVCMEWKNDFNAFYIWAINNGFKKELTLDRIDTNKDYSPTNCRWVDNLTQQNNKRNNRYLNYDNKKYTISQWSRILNIPKGTIEDRLRKKLPMEQVLNTNYKRNFIETRRMIEELE